MEILIRNQSRKKLIDAKQLRKLALLVMENLLEDTPFINPQVSLLFVDDAKIRKLNCKYRKIDTPTDVLSFPMLGEHPSSPNLEEPTILGDIVISLETASLQAHEQKHPLEKEIAVLLIHGFLHLLDFDDQEPKERKRMFSIQNRWIEFFETRGTI